MRRGNTGERGQTGDHGQDGRQGEPGAQGVRGIPGTSDQDAFEAMVVHVTAEALKASRLKLWDKRLLVIYALIAATGLGVFHVLDRRDDALIIVCQENVEGHIRQNATLDRLAENALSNPARTPLEREAIARDYEGLKQPITDCPPL